MTNENKAYSFGGAGNGNGEEPFVECILYGNSTESVRKGKEGIDNTPFNLVRELENKIMARKELAQ